MQDVMYKSPGRVAFKGQVFSAPMDWRSMLDQLDAAAQEESQICIPHTGEILALRVRIQISAGIVALNKCLPQATVRRNIVVQLISMFHSSGHPDYRRVNLEDVQRRAALLADSDEPSIPHGLVEILEDADMKLQQQVGTDKAATPAERAWSEQDLERNMARTRPNILFSQRDSDAAKEVEASRSSAFSKLSTVELRTGSELLDQFQGSYIPRVFHMSLPWCVGGPDLPMRPRYRRTSSEAPALTLDSFVRMIARRVETQIRWDWDLLPAAWSLWFATKVNLGVSLSLRRVLRSGVEETGH